MPETLFTCQPSNKHQSLLFSDGAGWQSISAKLNRERVAHAWQELDFHFEQLDKKATLVPDICTVYFPGVLAFRRDLQRDLFPIRSDALEFLPIRASGANWTLLNCLMTTSAYDREKSNVLRGESGEIFLIQRIYVTERPSDGCEFFTIADSNRAQLIVESSFAERVKRLRAQGVAFREIGQLL
jgi:hypothetical protein